VIGLTDILHIPGLILKLFISIRVISIRVTRSLVLWYAFKIVVCPFVLLLLAIVLSALLRYTDSDTPLVSTISSSLWHWRYSVFITTIQRHVQHCGQDTEQRQTTQTKTQKIKTRATRTRKGQSFPSSCKTPIAKLLTT
jgi:hypothetical protein